MQYPRQTVRYRRQPRCWWTLCWRPASEEIILAVLHRSSISRPFCLPNNLFLMFCMGTTHFSFGPDPAFSPFSNFTTCSTHQSLPSFLPWIQGSEEFFDKMAWILGARHILALKKASDRCSEGQIQGFEFQSLLYLWIQGKDNGSEYKMFPPGQDKQHHVHLRWPC